MEMLPHCTVPSRGSRARRAFLAVATVPLVLLVHGFHPFAEDGGLYVAGVEYTLDPRLFPHETAFVTEHLRFSCFAPVVAALVRGTHLSLPWILLALYLLSAGLTLYAGLRLQERCWANIWAQWSGVALFAAWWTMPVAGTSLLLMDPYVTARSFSTPFSLLAVAAALGSSTDQASDHTSVRRRRGSGARSNQACSDQARSDKARSAGWQCALWLALAALFHPLMAGYALGFVLMIALGRRPSSRPLWITFTAGVLLVAFGVQAMGHPDAPAVAAAVHSRYYWFLRQWQWYEWAGLLGPALVFAATLRWSTSIALTDAGRALCRAAMRLAVLSTAIALLFAQEHFRSHAVARLQPLRSFLLLYAAMALLAGGALTGGARLLVTRLQNVSLGRAIRALPARLIGSAMLTMFFVDRAGYPASPHVELPGRTNHNPWVQAFLWARDHTPNDALFALDARYVNTDGEDAQTFRSIAQRSAIPDFSKDGGEASITPALAPEWQRAAIATRDLSEIDDARRDALLLPFRVDWVVLHAAAQTAYRCPYANEVVKICQLH